MGSGEPQKKPENPATNAALTGCGCLLAIVGVLLCATVILIPIGVPLGLIGGFAFGYGMKKLAEKK